MIRLNQIQIVRLKNHLQSLFCVQLYIVKLKKRIQMFLGHSHHGYFTYVSRCFDVLCVLYMSNYINNLYLALPRGARCGQIRIFAKPTDLLLLRILASDKQIN